MSSTSNGSAAKRPITISFSRAGAQPPVYVASTLTSPPWEPLEMAISEERTAAGDFVFTRKYAGIEKGEYQYKFRLGQDWWVIDEGVPVVSDELGNKNNLLAVDAGRTSTSSFSKSETLGDRPSNFHRSQTFSIDESGHPEDESNVDQDDPSEEAVLEEDGPPLLPHESLAVVDNAPLLPHESFAIEEHPPLLPHESFSEDRPSTVRNRSSRSSSRSTSRSRSVRRDRSPDPSDPSVEPFPSSRADILNHIQRTEDRLEQDDTLDHGDCSPSHPSPAVEASQPPSKLPRVASAVSIDRNLNAIAEEEVPEESPAVHTEATTNPEPSVSPIDNVSKHSGLEAPSEGVEKNVFSTTSSQDSQSAPLTPPMTPADLLEEARRNLKQAEPEVKLDHSSNEPSSVSADGKSDPNVSSELTSDRSLVQDSEARTTPYIPSPLAQSKSTSESQKDGTTSSKPGSTSVPSNASVDKPVPKQKEALLRKVWRIGFASWLSPLCRTFRLCTGSRKAT